MIDNTESLFPVDTDKKLEIDFEKVFKTHLVIEASAGTGKTYTIVELISFLLSKEISLEKIGIMTFTEKAAGELKERIRMKLYDLIKGNPKNQYYQTALENFPYLTIGTIHNFSRLILNEASSFLPIDEVREHSDIISKQFEKFWAIEEAKEDSKLIELIKKISFTKFQDFIQQVSSKLKTHVTISKPEFSINEFQVFFLKVIEHFRSANNLNKDQKRKVEEFISEQENSNLREIFDSKGYLSREKLLNGNKVKGILDKANINYKTLNEELQKINEAENYFNSYPFLLTLVHYTNKFLDFLIQYKEKEMLIFTNDLILKGNELLSNNDSIRKYFRNKFSFIVVDEYQDTSPEQFDLCYKLFEDRDYGLVLVGDTKQSIYGFQNADLETLNEFKSKINFQKESLDITYRSSYTLMNSFNYIFNNISSLEYSNITTVREKKEQVSSGLILVGRKEFFSGDEIPSPQESIINTIKTIINNEKFKIISNGNTRKIGYGDITILARTNSAIKEIFYELRKASIPASVYRDKNYYDNSFVSALILLLQAIDNPSDSFSLYSILVSEIFLFNRNHLNEFNSSDFTYESLSSNDTLNKIFLSLQEAHATRFSFPASSIIQTVFLKNKVLERLSLGFGGKRNQANYHQFLEILNWEQIENKLNFSEISKKMLSNSKNSIEQEMRLEDENLKDYQSAVKLMTIHASKGLEFPVCILYGMHNSQSNFQKNLFLVNKKMKSEALVPIEIKISDLSTMSYSNELEIENESIKEEFDRLLYVALTRARDYLVLPFSRSNSHSKGVFESIFRDALAEDQFNTVLASKDAIDLDEFEDNSISIELKSKNKFKPKIDSEIIVVPEKKIRDAQGLKIVSYSSLYESEKNKPYIRPNLDLDTEDEENKKEIASRRTESIQSLFGVACHSVLEMVEKIYFQDEKKLLKRIEELASEYYTEDSTKKGFTKDELIRICFDALTTKYELAPNQFSFPKDWDSLVREKKFYQWKKTNRTDFLLGIADGMFISSDKYYILDWKSNQLENEFAIDILLESTENKYGHQINLYSYNLLNNLTSRVDDESEKKRIWEEKFGGMLFIYLRGLKEKKPSYILIKRTYEEVLNSIANLEKIA
ncbi:MAG: UvrD-helicase domain-containing protein [Leptospiraceae bacterium]|nr:UvrD-helicase domain-containing protein [Leptospiraceae bacterium]